jgi:hypothetical protein
MTRSLSGYAQRFDDLVKFVANPRRRTDISDSSALMGLRDYEIGNVAVLALGIMVRDRMQVQRPRDRLMVRQSERRRDSDSCGAQY